MKAIFLYNNKQYLIDCENSSFFSTLLSNKEGKFQENTNINLFTEFENINGISEESLTIFFDYFKYKQIELNPSTAISINYLAHKYSISDLIEWTEKYISDNINSIFDSIIKERNISFQAEQLLVSYFEKFINDDRLISLPISNLQRILTLSKSSKNKNSQFIEKNSYYLIDFIMKCFKFHGESASILFESFDFNCEERKYINKRLLEEKWMSGSQMVQTIIIDNLILFNSQNEEMNQKHENKINEIEEKFNKLLLINQNQKKEIDEMKFKHEIKINEIEKKYNNLLSINRNQKKEMDEMN